MELGSGGAELGSGGGALDGALEGALEGAIAGRRNNAVHVVRTTEEPNA